MKKLVLNQIENYLKNCDDEWIQKWLNGEITILEKVIKPNEGRLKPFKDLALSIVNTISIQDLQNCCIRAKPQLHEVWASDNAISRMNSELINIKSYIANL